MPVVKEIFMKNLFLVITILVVWWAGYDGLQIFKQYNIAKQERQFLQKQKNQLEEQIDQMEKYTKHKPLTLRKAFKRLVDQRNLLVLFNDVNMTLIIPNVKDKQDIQAYMVESDLPGIGSIPFKLSFANVNNDADLGFALQTVSDMEKNLDIKILGIKHSLKNGLVVDGAMYGIN
ncbi:MAG: hypothetical protein HQL25_01270 [Candidatus Omnitrophica bacterium]|nr:hypothetical protein [Candidatus Omnitrophota bacterium]